MWEKESGAKAQLNIFEENPTASWKLYSFAGSYSAAL